jgi:hypothetical protein
MKLLAITLADKSEELQKAKCKMQKSKCKIYVGMGRSFGYFVQQNFRSF